MKWKIFNHDVDSDDDDHDDGDVDEWNEKQFRIQKSNQVAVGKAPIIYAPKSLASSLHPLFANAQKSKPGKATNLITLGGWYCVKSKNKLTKENTFDIKENQTHLNKLEAPHLQSTKPFVDHFLLAKTTAAHLDFVWAAPKNTGISSKEVCTVHCTETCNCTPHSSIVVSSDQGPSHFAKMMIHP